jgi:hypothetical protein
VQPLDEENGGMVGLGHDAISRRKIRTCRQFLPRTVKIGLAPPAGALSRCNFA